LSTKSANRKLGWPRGRWCDKDEQAIGFRGALFGYFLGKQKVTKNMRILAFKGDQLEMPKVVTEKGTLITRIWRIDANFF
jgi:hypothetical protein